MTCGECHRSFYVYAMLKYLLFFLIVILLPDVYIWYAWVKNASSPWPSVALFAPTALLLFLMLASLLFPTCSWTFNAFFALLVCLAVPKLLFLLVAAIGELGGLCFPQVRLPIVRVGMLLAIMGVCIQLYGTFWGWKRLSVNQMELKLNNLPSAFDGYRVVQISDLHLGTYANDDRFVQRLVDSVNVCRPDLIVFTGDLVNASPDELPPFQDALKRLKAKDGILSVLGNHDYCLYGANMTDEERVQNKNRVVGFEQRLGWNVLLNSHVALTRGKDTLYVAGVENTGKPPFPSRGRVDIAFRGIPKEACVIMLSHDPWHWHHGLVGKSQSSLTLSGHTHAFQFRIGNFSPARWMIREWGGHYVDGWQQLYVSTGVGGTVAYRLGAWPKIECFTLRK